MVTREYWVNAISLSRNNRILASASSNNTARLWNFDTNSPVGPPLQHQAVANCAAFSVDAKVVVTGGYDIDVYAWDVHAILKEAGLEDLLPIPDMARKSLMNSDATRHPAIHTRRIPPGFFDGVRDGAQSSAVRDTHTCPRSPA